MKKFIYILMLLLFIGCVNQNNVTPPQNNTKTQQINNKKTYIDTNKTNSNEKHISNYKKNKNIDLKPIIKVESLLKPKIDIKKIKFKKTTLLYINLGTFVKFDSGKYEIKNLYKKNIKKFFSNLKDQNVTFLIVGHTDSIGNDIYNQALSEMRAKKVYNFFLKLGFKKKNLDYIGYGEEQPISTNATPIGRSKNRRVEIFIDKNIKISNLFLKTRKINKMFLNNHNKKTAGKIVISKKGWSKNLNTLQLKKHMIKCAKPKRKVLEQSFNKRTIILNFQKRKLYNSK